MLNGYKKGTSLDVVLAADTDGGDLVAIGDIVGVAFSGGETGDTVAVMLEGVYQVPKSVQTVGSGFAQGTKLYFDPATGGVTKTAGSLKAVGHAGATAVDADTKAYVRLVQ